MGAGGQARKAIRLYARSQTNAPPACVQLDRSACLGSPRVAFRLFLHFRKAALPRAYIAVVATGVQRLQDFKDFKDFKDGHSTSQALICLWCLWCPWCLWRGMGAEAASPWRKTRAFIGNSPTSSRSAAARTGRARDGDVRRSATGHGVGRPASIDAASCLSPDAERALGELRGRPQKVPRKGLPTFSPPIALSSPPWEHQAPAWLLRDGAGEPCAHGDRPTTKPGGLSDPRRGKPSWSLALPGGGFPNSRVVPRPVGNFPGNSAF